MSASAASLGSSEQVWRPAVNPWLIAIAVMSATFMEVLDTSVANVSLPHIAGTLSASTDEATWVLTSYLVSNAIILPATGWLTNFFGRKRLLMSCIIIFTAASALCGAATSLGFLIVARVLQGIGGGVLQPTAQAVLMESFPPEKRGQAMAVYGMGVVVAPIIGPTLGGWITDNYSWRWIFYINVPVGILAILMAYAFIEDPPYLRRNVRSNIDYIGFGLMTVALGAFQIVLDKGQQEDWFESSFILSLTVVAVLTLVAFIIWELQTEEPIVNLRVLKNRNFAIGTFLMTILGAALYSTTALLPLFLQTLLGYPSVESGLAVSPRGFGSLVSMMIVGRLIGKVDTRWLMGFGFSMLALSVYLLGNINLDITMSSVIWPNIISGFSMGFIFVPLSTTALSLLPRDQLGNATGIFSLMRNLGGGIGISAGTTLLARLAQSNQANMVGHLTPFDPAFRERFEQLRGTLGDQKAYATIYGILVKQANLLSFVSTFRILAVLCLLCLPTVFLLRKGKAMAKADAAVH